MLAHPQDGGVPSHALPGKGASCAVHSAPAVSSSWLPLQGLTGTKFDWVSRMRDATDRSELKRQFMSKRRSMQEGTEDLEYNEEVRAP